MITQFAARTTNSEKAVYFLSLMSYSVNKLKSHMFFTCKNAMFLILGEKKCFASGKAGGLAIYLVHAQYFLKN